MDHNKLVFNEHSVSIGDDFTMYSGLIIPLALECPVHSDRGYIGFCLDGYAEIEINLIKHTIIKNEIVVISQNQIVFHHKISDDFRFVYFSFSKEILSELLNDLRKYPPYFIFRRKFPSIMLNEMEMKQIMEYYNLMWNVTKGDKNDTKRDIVKHLFCSLMINIYLYASRDMEKPAPISRKEEMVGSFFSLIFEHFKEAKDVSFYASKLFVSPKYLSTLVRKTVGKTAKECIDHYVILESKVLLNSSFTIQEISQQLNFPNQSFFGKYFKKHTGMSPLNYRRSRLK
jgi:AraC-type DNA-binding domain-containing proteins